jgi:hypothetical protein
MNHNQMIRHLQHEFLLTVKYETGRLAETHRPAFFGVARAILCELDYLAALYCGWDGRDRRRIATPVKFRRFLEQVVTPATRNPGYATLGAHLYEIYRVGTVHLRGPKRLLNPHASTQELSWALLNERSELAKIGARIVRLRHLRLARIDPGKTLLPVSVQGLYRDLFRTCSRYVQELRAEKRANGTLLRDRWRTTADALVTPETTQLTW